MTDKYDLAYDAVDSAIKGLRRARLANDLPQAVVDALNESIVSACDALEEIEKSDTTWLAPLLDNDYGYEIIEQDDEVVVFSDRMTIIRFNRNLENIFITDDDGDPCGRGVSREELDLIGKCFDLWM